MSIEAILSALRSEDGEFPRGPLLDAAESRDQIVPALLQILQETRENYESLLGRDEYSAHIYSMYLLAQFRDYRAYPLVVDFFRIPEEAIEDLTGDLVPEDLHRILASVSCGDDRLIKGLIEDEDVSGFVRWAAVSSLLTLVACGEKSRKEIVEYFQSLFREKLERKPSDVWTGLVDASLDLYPEEVKADIERCFADELSDLLYSDPDDLKFALQQDKSEALERLRTSPHYSLVTDAVADLDPDRYYDTDESTEEWQTSAMTSSDIAQELDRRRYTPAEEEEPLELKPITRKQDKVGRNEPCPCGSGKKYKKCCGSKLDS